MLCVWQQPWGEGGVESDFFCTFQYNISSQEERGGGETMLPLHSPGYSSGHQISLLGSFKHKNCKKGILPKIDSSLLETLNL